MAQALKAMRDRFDRAGLLLSGLCVVHCLATLAVVALFGLSGGLLLDPAVHRFGLGLAVAIGAVALGVGIARHGRRGPLALGSAGLMLMALALGAPHGVGEASLTIAGVTLVALAHWRNVRHLASRHPA